MRNLRFMGLVCLAAAGLAFRGAVAWGAADAETACRATSATVATGALQVFLAPDQAVAAGARWRLAGSAAWFASGYTQSELATGTCTVEFEPVAGWTAPASCDVPILAGQTAVTTGTYALPPVTTGALAVTLAPSAAVAAGAQWRRGGTTVWLDSGTTETGVAPGQYVLEFRTVPGWIAPDQEAVSIAVRLTTLASATYEAFASGGVRGDYRVSYRGCGAAWDGTSKLSLAVGSGAAASVKIQRLKTRPDNTDDAEGKWLYLLDSPGIERIDVAGAMTRFYTDAPVGVLSVSGSVSSVASVNAAVRRIAAESALGSVRMTAVPGGANVGLPVTRIASNGSGGRPLAIALTGIVLEDLATGQRVASLSVNTKGFRDAATGALQVATGGVGRIAPEAVADTLGTYALVAPAFGAIAARGALVRPDELASRGLVGRITGKSLVLGGSLRPAMLGWETTPLRMVMKAEGFVLISANHGVHGQFWAGFASDSPTYTGTIGTVATTSGTLTGELRVAPGTVVKFKPGRGTMGVYYSD